MNRMNEMKKLTETPSETPADDFPSHREIERPSSRGTE